MNYSKNMYENISPKDTAERIRAEASRNGGNVNKMLASCGLDKSAISNMELRNKFPTVRNLSVIADYLGVTLHYLTTGETGASEACESSNSVRLTGHSALFWEHHKDNFIWLCNETLCRQDTNHTETLFETLGLSGEDISAWINGSSSNIPTGEQVLALLENYKKSIGYEYPPMASFGNVGSAVQKRFVECLDKRRNLPTEADGRISILSSMASYLLREDLKRTKKAEQKSDSDKIAADLDQMIQTIQNSDTHNPVID